MPYKRKTTEATLIETLLDFNLSNEYFKLDVKTKHALKKFIEAPSLTRYHLESAITPML